ncbi:TPA: hypothetical protein NWA42_002801 [Escherichia coli]|uniref:hypothetical protein n=1 Tax=Escherichia coli TaxID=562 RepID=UPI000A0F5FF9|nr:hypothetical protein [Escherichia coli]ECM7593659.1 hypothetical protein [Salmonella enterica subsp. enterica serovar Enteritidis]EFZ6456800.1 hypothetical protein [Shigella flexneri]EIL5663579.1 hypothetical protein [Salmonella enterica]EIP0083233.1 hypothetical protein [Salmonella enterica subsp. enterica serovar Ridge]EEA1788193.1 hypothetical protein [Salmonella enterica subsp. enterica serovar Enteritidis]
MDFFNHPTKRAYTMNNGYYFTDKMLAEQYAAKTNLQQRIYEYSQLGANKRLKPSTNRFTQIITEKRGERY